MTPFSLKIVLSSTRVRFAIVTVYYLGSFPIPYKDDALARIDPNQASRMAQSSESNVEGKCYEIRSHL